MTKGQEHLLKLLKELDEICRENDIQYFIAGGTLIGSVRHRGFVPWDDDADLYMTRDNFLKLVDVARKGELPLGRTLECQELSREYFNVFARYIDCTSTAIHKAQLITDDAAGEVIDILQLDPIPSSKRIQKKYFKYMLVYSDLVNTSTLYLHRQDSARFLYKKYCLLQKILGKDKTLSILEKKMFNYSEEKCDYYFMRWGGTPLIFEKDMFSESLRIPYEDIETSIPKRYNDYLIYHYGEEWDNVPDISEQMSHTAVHCLKTDYLKVKKTYVDIVDKEEIVTNQIAYKNSKIRWAKARHKNLDVYIKMKSKIVVKETTKKIKYAKCNLNKLYRSGYYVKLCSIFDMYYKWQANAIVSGRDTYAGLYRYKKPVLVELPLNILVIALRTQMDIGRASKSYRTIEIYEYCKKRLPKQLKEIKKHIEYMRQAFSEYSYGNYEVALEYANKVLQYSKNNKPAMIMKIKCLINCNLSDEIIDETFSYAMKKFPKDVEIRKLWIDYYYNKKELALKAYKKIRREIINGYTRLDIQDREQEYLHELIEEIKSLKEKGFIDKIQENIEKAMKLSMTHDERVQFVGYALENNIDSLDYKKLFYSIIDYKDLQDFDNFKRVCVNLLVLMGEEAVIADTYFKVRTMNDTEKIKDEIKVLLGKYNEKNEIVINNKLKKLYADILCKELNVKKAYDIYLKCYYEMSQTSLLYDELLERFRSDVEQIEYMNEIGALEMRQKNICTKFGDETKFFSLLDDLKDKFDKRNDDEQISE